MKVEAHTSPPFFTVNADCISCAACWKLVPEHFTSHPIDTVAFVSKQPTHQAEVDRCRQALNICPVNAIKELHEQPID